MDEGCVNCDSSGWLDARTITIVIRREWFTCNDCEQGSDYRCVYDVRVSGQTECSFDSDHKAHAYIETAYPNVESHVEEDDGEGWLRRAEGWGS
jgi:hypothetical protein